MNSRPLTQFSVSPDDFDAITPNSLLHSTLNPSQPLGACFLLTRMYVRHAFYYVLDGDFACGKCGRCPSQISKLNLPF